jgi:hypothetical protein
MLVDQAFVAGSDHSEGAGAQQSEKNPTQPMANLHASYRSLGNCTAAEIAGETLEFEITGIVVAPPHAVNNGLPILPRHRCGRAAVTTSWRLRHGQVLAPGRGHRNGAGRGLARAKSWSGPQSAKLLLSPSHEGESVSASQRESIANVGRLNEHLSRLGYAAVVVRCGSDFTNLAGCPFP